MSTPVFAVGLLLAGIGAACAAFPVKLVSLVSRLRGKWWVLPVGAAIRVGLGGILVLAAEGSRHPTVVAGLGLFLIAAGVLILVLDRKRIERWIAWWTMLPAWAVRLSAGATLAFGLVLVAVA